MPTWLSPTLAAGSRIRVRALAIALIVGALGLGAPVAQGASCRVSAQDRQAVREVSAAERTAVPAIAAVGVTNPTRAQVSRAAQAVGVVASTARISQDRATNATLKSIFRDYARGWAQIALGLNVALAGDSRRGSTLMDAGRLPYKRGQATFRRWLIQCGFGPGSFR